MNMREHLIAHLRREEGEVLHVYKDHLGYLTIGVGRLIDKRKGGCISP
jgi:lysozyme